MISEPAFTTFAGKSFHSPDDSNEKIVFETVAIHRRKKDGG